MQRLKAEYIAQDKPSAAEKLPLMPEARCQRSEYMNDSFLLPAIRNKLMFDK
jgi:hypothetical protein